MPKVSLQHASIELMELFKKEQEVVEKITPFCNQADIDIEVLYSMSAYGIWRLEIKTTKNER